MVETITESTGNVFADLGFEPGEAAILHMRAKLMSDLREVIDSSAMTQTQAAEKLGIAPVSYTHLTLPTNREV